MGPNGFVPSLLVLRTLPAFRAPTSYNSTQMERFTAFKLVEEEMENIIISNSHTNSPNNKSPTDKNMPDKTRKRRHEKSKNNIGHLKSKKALKWFSLSQMQKKSINLPWRQYYLWKWHGTEYWNKLIQNQLANIQQRAPIPLRDSKSDPRYTCKAIEEPIMQKIEINRQPYFSSL